MLKTKMTIHGKVQNVGLRVQIKDIADSLGVCGTVENLLDGSVLVICEAEPDVVEEMIRQIRYETNLAIIKDIKAEPAGPATNMTDFVVIWGDSISEIINGIHAGRKILLEVSKTLNKMNHNQDHMMHGLDHMAQSQDHMAHGLDHMAQSQDHMMHNLDHMAHGLDHMAQSQDHMMHNLDHMAQSLDHIKQGQDHVIELLKFIASKFDALSKNADQNP